MNKTAIVLHPMVQCMLNRNHCQRTRDYLELNGYRICSSMKDAELIIFSGCGVLESNEIEGLDKIKQIEQFITESNSNQKLVLVGCLPKINAKTRGKHLYKGEYREMQLGPHYKADPEAQFILVDNYDYSVFDALIQAHIPFDTVPNPPRLSEKSGFNQMKFVINSIKGITGKNKQRLQKNYMEMLVAQSEIEKTGYFYPGLNDYLFMYGYNQITIGSGCRNSCAYCAVKFSKNKIKSVRAEVIIAQIKELVGRGETKFVLMSDDLGSWGIDLKLHWTYLLDEIMKIEGAELKLALFNLKAEDMLNEKSSMDRYVNSGKISYICAMSQHVNPRMLEYMKREPFDKELFISTINEYGDKDVHIETFTIVGFPGETEAEFQEVVDFIERIKTPRFANRSNPFSERHGTAAAGYPDKLPQEVVMDRVKTIIDVYLRTSRERYKVLPENVQISLNKMQELLNEHELIFEEVSTNIMSHYDQ